MRKYSRLLAMALTLVLVFLLCCSGCGNSQNLDSLLNPKEPVSIEIWHYYNGPQKIAFDKAVSEFNETVGLEKGIVVEAFSQGNVNDLTEMVLDAAAKKVGASEIPDIFAAYADTAYQVDQLGLVAELDPYFTEEEIQEYVPAYLEEGRFDKNQSLKIFPIAKSSEIMMINQTDWDKFAAATGAKIEDLKTIEGIAKVAKQYYDWTDSLTPEPDDGKAFFGRDAMANYMIIGCKQLGVEIFEVKNGEVQLNLDKEVLRKLWDNYYVPYINGYFAHYGRFRSDDAKTGDIIALVGSTSGAAYFPDEVTTDTVNYPITAISMESPCFEDGEKVAVQQGAGMVVTKSAEAKEYAATIFLKWFADTERNIAFSVSSGYLPVKTEANDVEKVKSVMAKSEDTMAANQEESLPISINMVKTYSLYTSKAFQGGTEARKVLEYSMIDLAKADAEAIQADMQNGSSKAEAVAKYDTDAHFEEWFQDFQKSLSTATK